MGFGCHAVFVGKWVKSFSRLNRGVLGSMAVCPRCLRYFQGFSGMYFLVASRIHPHDVVYRYVIHTCYRIKTLSFGHGVQKVFRISVCLCCRKGLAHKERGRKAENMNEFHVSSIEWFRQAKVRIFIGRLTNIAKNLRFIKEKSEICLPHAWRFIGHGGAQA